MYKIVSGVCFWHWYTSINKIQDFSVFAYNGKECDLRVTKIVYIMVWNETHKSYTKKYWSY